MAIIFAYQSLLMSEFNFGRIITGIKQSNFYDDFFLTVNGTVYSDILEIRYEFLDVSRDLYFAGSEITVDNLGNVSGGNVTGLMDYFWNGSGWIASWSIVDISYNAVDLYGSFKTTETSDDHAILQQILSGADDVSGSESVDIILAYGGNDVVLGGDGDDTMDGGSGTDTARFSGSISQYRVGYSGNIWMVRGPDGLDTLSNFENIQFGASNPSSIDTLIAMGSADELISVNRNGQNTYVIPDFYSGAVSYLKYQMLGSVGADVVGGTSKSDFFNLLGGDDAVNGAGGDDVLDGGVGSNFLTGGTGRDVFYLDGRDGGTTWATITDWEAGEELSLWGWQKDKSVANWTTSDGAPGWQGVTLHADIDGDGVIETSVTWTGLAKAQLPTAIDAFDGLLWFKTI